ncbi:conserved hypothetical protein, partial [Listeria ivanovii FSL F6-596]
SEVNLPVLVETDTNAAILGYKNRWLNWQVHQYFLTDFY